MLYIFLILKVLFLPFIFRVIKLLNYYIDDQNCVELHASRGTYNFVGKLGEHCIGMMIQN